jgi:sulfite reductase alpha subunit-like flavoprotein
MEFDSAGNTLYFGCRSANKDQHYRAEWASYATADILSYRVACSRDGPHGLKRTYVQDLIRQDAKQIWDTLTTEGACIFISGWAFAAFISTRYRAHV